MVEAIEPLPFVEGIVYGEGPRWYNGRRWFSDGPASRVVAGGTVTHRVAIDRGWAVAPALGGADGRTLYMVIDETTLEGLVAGESTGWIMQARVDVPGAGSP